MKYIYRFTILLLCVFFYTCTTNQPNNPSDSTPPTIQWQKLLGGSSEDFALSVEQTTDGGYIVAGYTMSTDGDVIGNHGYNDYWIVKLGADGSLQWKKSLGGTYDDKAYSIRQTSDGGYIIAGSSTSFDGDVKDKGTITEDYWIIKLAPDGSLQWQKSFGNYLDDAAYSIQQTNDGGYVVAGDSHTGDLGDTTNHGKYDCWVVKLGVDGSLQWQKMLGGSEYDIPNSIQQTKDGGYIIAAQSNSHDGNITGNHGGKDDCWIIKLNSEGVLQWQKTLGGDDDDFARYAEQTSDGGYIVAGSSKSNGGDVTGNHGKYDCWVVKLNADGTLQWQKSLGGSDDDYGGHILQTNGGGYIVTGSSKSKDGNVEGNNGNRDAWMVKLNSTGAILWQKNIGGTSNDWFNSIKQTSDGGYIAAGGTNSNDGAVTGNHGSIDYWIVKLK